MNRRHTTTQTGRRAFSLTEVLLAIFILGIGVIAVASLFPAGIAQQRHSVDDIIGPVVANNALSLLRTKLSADDFGTYGEFGLSDYWCGGADPNMPRTVDGDFMWARPGFFFDFGMLNVPTSPQAVEVRPGDISIFWRFNDAADAEQTRSEIPWNTTKFQNTAPFVLVTQQERYYPMQPRDCPFGPPEYVWDCMFRRFQGRILVAIFVYRPTATGGAAVHYNVPRVYQGHDPDTPPPPPWDDIQGFPYRLTVTAADDRPNAIDDYDGEVAGVPNYPPGYNGANWSAGRELICGSEIAGAGLYNQTLPDQAWQDPRQWLLDQNNNVHRVLSRVTNDGTGRSEVELQRPLGELPCIAPYYYSGDYLYSRDNCIQYHDLAGPGNMPNGLADHDLVTDIWYIPVEFRNHPIWGDFKLVPVYVTVREL